ncbi:MAG: 23S rRNA (adenine(2030)-N(6))-methyltransferase RlmJ [Pseudomonadota bacterium]
MLSYQHAFHAGNRADVLKHAAAHALWSDLAQAGDPVLHVETHAGRGVYDLEGAEARKTGEAADGALRLLSGDAPRLLRPWLSHIAEAGPGAYPGSPVLAAKLLGETARLVLFERHPAEFDALNSVFAGDDRVQIKKADGYAGAMRLTPRRGERMSVFVDPSYETERDIDALADWTPRALRRWPDALIVLWLPLFKDGREQDAGAYLAELGDGVIAGARWPNDEETETSLEGSAIIAYRASPSAGDRIAEIAAALTSYWSGG